MLKILPYLKLCVEKNASDIYFTSNAPAMLRIEGGQANGVPPTNGIAPAVAGSAGSPSPRPSPSAREGE